MENKKAKALIEMYKREDRECRKKRKPFNLSLFEEYLRENEDLTESHTKNEIENIIQGTEQFYATQEIERRIQEIESRKNLMFENHDNENFDSGVHDYWNGHMHISKNDHSQFEKSEIIFFDSIKLFSEGVRDAKLLPFLYKKQKEFRKLENGPTITFENIPKIFWRQEHGDKAKLAQLIHALFLSGYIRKDGKEITELELVKIFEVLFSISFPNFLTTVGKAFDSPTMSKKVNYFTNTLTEKLISSSEAKLKRKRNNSLS